MPFRVVVTLFFLLAVGTASHAPCTLFPNYALPPQPRCDLASEEPDDPETGDEQPDDRRVAPDPTPTTRADEDASPAPSPRPQPVPTTTGGTMEPLGTPASPADTTVASSPPVDTPSVTDADRPAADIADDAGDRGPTGPSSTVVALVLVAVSAVGILLGKVFARGSRRST